jgi:trehalose 6-phosphate phosphatase
LGTAGAGQASQHRRRLTDAVRSVLPNWLSEVRAERILLVSDFDGTLSEIVPNPEQARLAPGAARILAALAKRLLRICVLSSRGSPQLRGLVPVAEVELLGDYGMTALTERDSRNLQMFNQQAERLLSRRPGVTVEEKPGSTAIHYRGAPTAGPRLAAELAPVARRLELVLGSGRAVIEVRPRTALKSLAVSRLLDALQPEAVIYLGDDDNDRPVFELLAQRSTPHFSVGVASDESPPGLFTHCELVVAGPRAVVAFLSRLSGALPSAKSRAGRSAAGRSSA